MLPYNPKIERTTRGLKKKTPETQNSSYIMLDNENPEQDTQTFNILGNLGLWRCAFSMKQNIGIWIIIK